MRPPTTSVWSNGSSLRTGVPSRACQLSTKSLNWVISERQAAAYQAPTPAASQKWPLKWLPISWPADHASVRSAIRSGNAARAAKPTSEDPGGLPGGRYWVRRSSGSR